MTSLGPSHIVDASAVDESLPVSHDGVWNDDDPGPDELRSPAEIHILTTEGHGVVEPIQRVEQVGADEDASRRHREDVTDGGTRITVERTVRGTLNGGGPEMRFKSYNGSIYIRSSDGRSGG